MVSKARIRKRATYARWTRFLDFLRTKPSEEAILLYVHNMLDDMYAYGTETIAKASYESLKQVLEDNEYGTNRTAE